MKKGIVQTYIASLALFAGVFGAIPAQAALDFPSVGDLEVGDLIRTEESSTVYYFGADEQRYGFPNESTFFTWYDNFNDVEIVTQEDMAAIPLGGMVTYFPQFGNGELSTRLIKRYGDDTVYVPIGQQTLVGIKNAGSAEALFGQKWQESIDFLPDAFAHHYTFTETLIDQDTVFDQEDESEITKSEDGKYTISDDLDLSEATGVMMYMDPKRFASSDESVCDQDYCSYNEVYVDSGDTVKFINNTDETVVVRDEDNLWTTGEMAPEDIVVVAIDLEEGEYTFYGNDETDFVGTLIVD